MYSIRHPLSKTCFNPFSDTNSEQTITLLGPTRMDYDKALSALEYLSEELTKYFNKLNGGNNDGGDA